MNEIGMKAEQTAVQKVIFRVLRPGHCSQEDCRGSRRGQTKGIRTQTVTQSGLNLRSTAGKQHRPSLPASTILTGSSEAAGTDQDD